jgi:hypothetical protein
MAIRGAYRISPVENRRLRRVIRILNTAKTFKTDEPDFLGIRFISRKQDNPVDGVKETAKRRDHWSSAYGIDRSFPLETVQLESFNQKHDKNVESATIHIGPNSDELAHSMNFLAFVIAADIYFRSNKFNTTTEEGRKLLAHELTHVAQSKDRGYKGKEELELEAEQEEYVEVVEADPLETITIGGKEFRIRKSQQRKLVCMTAEEIVRDIEKEEFFMDGEEYLALLLKFKKMITRFDAMYETKTEADRWMENELKKELRRLTWL